MLQLDYKVASNVQWWILLNLNASVAITEDNAAVGIPYVHDVNTPQVASVEIELTWSVVPSDNVLQFNRVNISDVLSEIADVYVIPSSTVTEDSFRELFLLKYSILLDEEDFSISIDNDLMVATVTALDGSFGYIGSFVSKLYMPITANVLITDLPGFNVD